MKTELIITKEDSIKAAIEIIDLLECLGFTSEYEVNEITLTEEISNIIQKHAHITR